MEKIRPVDVREGDILIVGTHRDVARQVVVVGSYLAEGGESFLEATKRNPPERLRRAQWWITYVFTNETGRVEKLTQRWNPGKMVEPCLTRV